MPRRRRATPGGYVYHVLNRGVGRMVLFDSGPDYAAFIRIVVETLAVCPMRICGFCLMPNHWHFVLWPQGDDDLSAFVQRMTVTHAARLQKHRGAIGTGHVYQGRYKSFPVENDEHFYRVLRYVERNGLRANLVSAAEDWRWSSCWMRNQPLPAEQRFLADCPLPLPTDWTNLVNQAQSEAELAALRRCIRRGQPYGDDAWISQTAAAMGLDSTLRTRGRPRIRE